MIPSVYIRVDGSSSIGLGHVVRCIALAQMLSSVFEVRFFCKHLPDNIREDILKLNLHLSIIKEEEDFLNIVHEGHIVVLDHYELGTVYQQAIKDKGAKLVCIADVNDQPFYADVILNHAPQVDTQSYQAPVSTQYAFGLDYVLLRPVFLEAAKQSIINRSKLDVFVCFGGADPKNITQQVVNVLKDDKRFNKIHVVLGSAYSFVTAINDSIKDDQRFSVHHSVSETAMCALMSSSGLAIVPSSGVLQEALATGCKVISGAYVENQALTYQNYLKLGAFESAFQFSPTDIRKALDAAIIPSAQTPRFIDGKSAERILKLFCQLQAEDMLTLTQARESDLLTTFRWANDASIRAFSFSQEPISLTVHSNWFLNKINNENCLYYLGVIDGVAVGSIRFDITGNTALISYLIDPSYHNQGLGLLLLKKGVSRLLDDTAQRISTIVGMVMVENIASVKAFERLGYIKNVEQGNYKFVKNINYENRFI